MFVQEGQVEVHINEQKHILGMGDIIAIPLFSIVTTKVLANVKVLSICLPPDFFHLCLSRNYYDAPTNNHFSSTQCSEPLHATAAVTSFTTQMFFYLERIPFCKQLHQEKINELGILLYLSYSKEELSKLLRPLFYKEREFVNKINTNLDYFVTVENMASHMNMSISVFNTKFKSVFNESPYKWLLKQKAQIILQYISVHNCTIKDVIDTFNFTSPSHFHRFCLSQYICSPAELFKKMEHAPKK